MNAYWGFCLMLAEAGKVQLVDYHETKLAYSASRHTSIPPEAHMRMTLCAADESNFFLGKNYKYFTCMPLLWTNETQEFCNQQCCVAVIAMPDACDSIEIQHQEPEKV